jgi:hypothetical protein
MLLANNMTAQSQIRDPEGRNVNNADKLSSDTKCLSENVDRYRKFQIVRQRLVEADARMPPINVRIRPDIEKLECCGGIYRLLRVLLRRAT